MSFQDLISTNTREEILPLDMDHLPGFFKQKAVKEINYSPDKAEKAMRELKTLISNDDSLKKLNFKDGLLDTFLTCRKYNVDRAFKQLKEAIKFRKKHPDMFFIPSFDVLSVFMTEGTATILPWRCGEGCAIIYINVGKWNLEKQPLDAVKQFYCFVILQCLRKPMTQVNGFKVIMDLNISLDILKKCTPSNTYLFINGIFVICPARFKAIHFLNMNGVGRMLWQIMKVFFPAKLRDRVQIHKTKDTLLDFFDREVLPCHLGGDLKNYDMTWWLKKYLTPEEKCALEI